MWEKIWRKRRNCRRRDRPKGAEERCSRLWLCLNSTRVCQQYNQRIYRGTESLIFIPMGLKSDGFSTKATSGSLSQMAQRQTFPLQPLCAWLSTASVFTVSMKRNVLPVDFLPRFCALMQFQNAFICLKGFELNMHNGKCSKKVHLPHFILLKVLHSLYFISGGIQDKDQGCVLLYRQISGAFTYDFRL